VLGGHVALEPEVEERADVGVGYEDDAAAITAVAACGAALGDVGFAAEGDGALTAIAGGGTNGDAVDEAHL